MRCLKRNSGCYSQSALRVCEQNGVWHMHTAHAVATSFYQASLFQRTETYMLDLQSAHDLQLTSVRMFVSNSYAMHCNAIPLQNLRQRLLSTKLSTYICRRAERSCMLIANKTLVQSGQVHHICRFSGTAGYVGLQHCLAPVCTDTVCTRFC